MRPVIITGAIAMLVTVIIAANLSMVRPRPKPVEAQSPVEQTLTETSPQTLPPVVLVQKQAERLKRIEHVLKEQTAQARRIDQKLDAFLRVEEAKDAGGQ